MSRTDITSASLLAKVKSRDNVAWRRLTRIYGPTVYRWCRSRGLQSADAADVVQDVFRSVAIGIDNFQKVKPEDTFRGWLRSVCNSRLMDFFRRKRRQPSSLGDGDILLPEENLLLDSNEVGDNEHIERNRCVQRCIEEIRGDFQEKTWQAFWRTVVGGDRPIDVAKDQGTTIAAVCMGRVRVLRRLRETLNGLEDWPHD